MDIYVIDIETTGLDGWQKNHIVEISIMKANLTKQKIEQVYHSLVHYDITKWDEITKNAWIFEKGIIKLDEIQSAKKDIKEVSNDVRKILTGKFISAYNNGFDFTKFLLHEPWNINPETCKIKIAPCIMLATTDYIKIPTKYKKRKLVNLSEARKHLLNENTTSIINNKEIEKIVREYGVHRANCDAFYSACVLLELYKRKKYRVYPKIYYAHSMQIYKSKQERREIKIIKKIFPKAEIVNPAKYEKKWKNLSGKEVMTKCLNLISNSDMVIFSAIKQDNKDFVGRGVYVEVKFAEEIEKDTYFLQETLESDFSLEIYNDDDWNIRFSIVR
ncbi:MAG: exonuclease domain-containing protein [Candidatus Heimdallarchaeaceae archaeon]